MEMVYFTKEQLEDFWFSYKIMEATLEEGLNEYGEEEVKALILCNITDLLAIFFFEEYFPEELDHVDELTAYVDKEAVIVFPETVTIPLLSETKIHSLFVVIDASEQTITYWFNDAKPECKINVYYPLAYDLFRDVLAYDVDDPDNLDNDLVIDNDVDNDIDNDVETKTEKEITVNDLFKEAVAQVQHVIDQVTTKLVEVKPVTNDINIEVTSFENKRVVITNTFFLSGFVITTEKEFPGVTPANNHKGNISLEEAEIWKEILDVIPMVSLPIEKEDDLEFIYPTFWAELRKKILSLPHENVIFHGKNLSLLRMVRDKVFNHG